MPKPPSPSCLGSAPAMGTRPLSPDVAAHCSHHINLRLCSHPTSLGSQLPPTPPLGHESPELWPRTARRVGAVS